ncbi:MAG: hypothetical protein IMZ57_04035 [Acidobacteria bacterium]|nr:hypothetical protein [Acidobacteriota bacterium]
MPSNSPVLKKKLLDRFQTRKCCWVARQSTKGWRLGLCAGNDKAEWLPVWFRSKKDVEKVVELGIVFVYLDDATEAEGV